MHSRLRLSARGARVVACRPPASSSSPPIIIIIINPCYDTDRPSHWRSRSRLRSRSRSRSRLRSRLRLRSRSRSRSCSRSRSFPHHTNTHTHTHTQAHTHKQVVGLLLLRIPLSPILCLSTHADAGSPLSALIDKTMIEGQFAGVPPNVSGDKPTIEPAKARTQPSSLQ